MNWFYLREEGPSGPHDGRKMADLGRVGVLTSSSLVWRSGFEKWTAISDLGGIDSYLLCESASLEGEVEQAEPPRIQIALCAVSGALGDRESMLEYGSQFVLPEHKGQFTQELYENVEKPAEDLELIADRSIITCFKQTFQIIRREWILFFGSILIFYVPFELITGYLYYFIWEEGSFLDVGIPLFFELLVGSLIASGLYSIAASHWQSRVEPIGSIIEIAFGRWFRLIHVRINVWVATFVGALFLVLPGLFVLFILMFAEAFVFSAERQRGLSALTASWHLVRENFGKALWFGLGHLGIIVSPMTLLWVGYYYSPFDHWLIGAVLAVMQDVMICAGIIYVYCAMEHLES